MPPPSSHTTGRAVPHPAVHEVVWKRCRGSSSETRPTLANQDLGSAWFMCEAPPFHHGPRPLLAEVHALSFVSPHSSGFRRVQTFASTAARSSARSLVLQHSLLLGQAKVIGPSSQEGVELLDRFGQALAASFAEHLPHLGFEAFAAGFGVQWTVGQSSDPQAKPAAGVTAPITTKS